MPDNGIHSFKKDIAGSKVQAVQGVPQDNMPQWSQTEGLIQDLAVGELLHIIGLLLSRCIEQAIDLETSFSRSADQLHTLH
jgi:hypothetical protein